MTRFLYKKYFPGIVMRILLIHFKNDQKILINILIRKLDDHRILVKFQEDFDQNSFKELDVHGIFVKFFKDFDQNSVGLLNSLKNQRTTEFL